MRPQGNHIMYRERKSFDIEADRHCLRKDEQKCLFKKKDRYVRKKEWGAREEI